MAKKIFLESSEKDSALVRELTKLGIDYVNHESALPTSHYREGKQSIQLVAKKGESMDTCATIHDDYICCNVKVLKSVSNCPFDCSYCFLQNYLNDGQTKVVADIDGLMTEVIDKCGNEPHRLFRIGTWELGDSLALENDVPQASLLIERFASLSNAVLELKTKSNVVEPILSCEHQGRTVVSWSLNSDFIVQTQEHKTASLSQRLTALTTVTNAGYKVGLHFDPVIFHTHWKDEYADLIHRSIAATSIDQIAWISLGSLRFNPEMKRKIEANFPAANITTKEMVLGDDGKVRYVKPLRIEMYTHIISELKKALGVTDLSPLSSDAQHRPLFYFCMERWDVWKKCLGDSPQSIQHLDYLFACNWVSRFESPLFLYPRRRHYQ